MDFVSKQRYTLQDLIGVVALLRDPVNGCPWDKEQTHESLRRDLLEEAYETVDAIDAGDPAPLAEELGDVLLQLLLHARIEEEQGSFSFDDICDGLCKKLVFRHPHVFGEAKADTAADVLTVWDEQKALEKQPATAADTLRAVPQSFPGLMRAQKMQKRAAKAGMDFQNAGDALARLEDEVRELREAVDAGGDVQGELGDVFFSTVNVTRLLGFDAEDSVRAASDRFLARFALVEDLAARQGLTLKQTPQEQQDALWQRAKSLLTKE